MCDDRRIRDDQVGYAAIQEQPMNKMWIRARICEILMDRSEIHYVELLTYFDSSCHKAVIVVLAEMYHENRIWSTAGVARWDTRDGKFSNGTVTFLCQMIAGYAKVSLGHESAVKWGVL